MQKSKASLVVNSANKSIIKNNPLAVVTVSKPSKRQKGEEIASKETITTEPTKKANGAKVKKVKKQEKGQTMLSVVNNDEAEIDDAVTEGEEFSSEVKLFVYLD